MNIEKHIGLNNNCEKSVVPCANITSSADNNFTTDKKMQVLPSFESKKIGTFN